MYQSTSIFFHEYFVLCPSKQYCCSTLFFQQMASKDTPQLLVMGHMPEILPSTIQWPVFHHNATDKGRTQADTIVEP